jgi:hypothetical protein
MPPIWILHTPIHTGKFENKNIIIKPPDDYKNIVWVIRGDNKFVFRLYTDNWNYFEESV